jgi:hypothetical protein
LRAGKPKGNKALAKYVIVLLAGVALWMLYRGMKLEQAAPDPRHPPTADSILVTIHYRTKDCDKVTEFGRWGSEKGWDFYLAKCADGGRYVYLQSASEGKVYAYSCREGAQHGYYCPAE